MRYSDPQSQSSRPATTSNAVISIAAASVITGCAYAYAPSQHNAPSGTLVVRAEVRGIIRSSDSRTFPTRSNSLKRDRESLRQRFEFLADQFLAATAFTSSTHDIVTNAAHLKIIALGKETIPLIVEKLRNDDGYWFAALESLSDANPVNSEDRGSYDKMKAAWLAFLAQERDLNDHAPA